MSDAPSSLPTMDRFERQLLRRLVFEPHRLSRNRNFYAFDDPAMRRLRRLAGLLRGLRAELAEARPDRVRVRVEDDGFVEITIERPESAARRRVRVAPDELVVLREDPAVRACLDAAGAAAGDQGADGSGASNDS